MLQSLKPYKCPTCKSFYRNRDITRQYYSTKFPLILPCGHTACESCLQTAVKNKSQYACTICKHSVDLSEGVASISKLPPDIYALGILHASTKQPLPSFEVKMVSSSESVYENSSILKNFICDHCRKVSALWQCDECQLNFCNLCCDQIHNDVKSKKKHVVKKIYADSYTSSIQEGCPEHNNKPFEFYCEVDNEPTCSHCMLIGSHMGHQVKTLVNKNESCAESLRNALNNLPNTEKRIKYTLHLLNQSCTKEKLDVTEYIDSIHDQFHKLHCILQAQESSLVSKLHDIASQNNDPFDKMRSTLSGYQKDIIATRKDTEAVIDNPCLTISAPKLLEKLESFKSLPVVLKPVENEEIEKTTVNIEFNKALEEEIKSAAEIKYSIKESFRLVPQEESDDDDALSDIPESFCSLSEVESVTIESISEDSLVSSTTNHSSLKATLRCQEFAKGQPEKVMVSHIKDPSCFWIQRYADLKKFNSISESINKWCKSQKNFRGQGIKVENGDLYLVQFSVDKKWYRGRVMRILEPGENFEIRSVKDNSVISQMANCSMVEVFYVDYGNTEFVPVSKLMNIEARFLSLPVLAKRCSLVDVEPNGSKSWSVEAIKTFTKFVSNKPVIMKIYEQWNNILHVDLSQVADSGIANDVPVSVRDALVFLEFAVFPSNTTVPSPRNKIAQKKYLPPERLKANTQVQCIVSHVESPYHIFIQQMSTTSYLSSLIFEMNQKYNNDLTSLHHIYAPQVGMMCAAQFTDDKQWYRAEVISLPGGATVEVRYVDFGNSEVLNYRYLRKLFDNFARLNIQAIPCKLADVTYNQETCWSTEAKEFLTNKVSKKHLTLKCLGYLPDENKNEVVLYFNDGDYSICINALLVEARLASSTGPASTIVRKPADTPKAKKVSEKFATPLASKSAPTSAATEVQSSIQTIVKSIPTSENYKQVVISYIKSPSLFYVRPAGDSEKNFKILMKEMQSVYKNFESKVDVTVGNSYAVFSEVEQKWFRANILSKTEDMVVVHYVDYGHMEVVSVKNVQKLLDVFLVDDLTICCELTGILPAGGSIQWSYAACDAFKEIISPYETLYISTTQSKVGDGPVPVTLYFDQLLLGGALEPTKLVRKNVAEELINRGVALPVRNSTQSSNQPKALSDPPRSDEKTIEEVPDVPVIPDVSDELSSCPGTSNRLSPNLELKDSTSSSPKKSQSASASPIKESESASASPKKSSQSASASPKNFSNPLKSTSNSSLSSVESVLAATACSSNKPIKCEDKANCKGSDIEVKEVESVQEPHKPTFQWLPVVYPSEPNFKGFVTNIGDDGCIQVHALKDGSSKVETIRKSLQFKYERSSYEVLEKAPPVGEACIAKFPVDNSWYRAEILSVYTDKVKVHFVDYGNNEYLALSDIRLDIMMLKLPKQCIECTLAGIHTGTPGKCDEDLLNFLHNQLVESVVDVEIVGIPDENGKLPCNITTSCGISVAELMDSMGFLDAKADVPNGEDKAFAKATELPKGEVFPVCVTQLNSPNVVYVQRLKNPAPASDCDVEHNKELEAFLGLVAELQSRAESFPFLQDPVVGMPCCAKYSYDNNWYRCEIVDIEDIKARVLYVDYGNSEVVSFDDLRMLSFDFIKFPVQAHLCKISGMKPADEEWVEEVLHFMVQKLQISGSEIFARVVQPGSVSDVELLTKDENGELVLVYKELLEKNLICMES